MKACPTRSSRSSRPSSTGTWRQQNKWLAQYAPNHTRDHLFLNITARMGDSPAHIVLCKFAGLKWLNLRRPDFRQVMEETAEALRQEVLHNFGVDVDHPPTAAAS